jgi:methylmalonyl-CoA mutase cobalamin-binding subunit
VANNDYWTRQDILPEPDLPQTDALIALGRERAKSVTVGSSAFLKHHGLPSELAFKQQCMTEGAVMVHIQMGYRDPEKSRHAFRHIHARVTERGGRVDRYGICLDWSMGYKAADRSAAPKGTGLILKTPEDFQRLCAEAPVAPHFGDFVLGMPAALENTEAALQAGSTTIGNMGQFFTFRLPHYDNDVQITEATVTALSLCAAQPVPILIHSNVDDGFAAQFSDLSCALGAVLLERHVVDGLLGCTMGHCYGHTFTDPLSRWAFQRALANIGGVPGTMIYGNTTAYGSSEAENYAALASYLGTDIAAQRFTPTGHAINPIPITEAERIPEIDEIVDAALFAARLIDTSEALTPLYHMEIVDTVAEKLISGATSFRDRLLADFTENGIDTNDATEMLLTLKRLGARRMEALYGPGAPDISMPNGRRPIVESPVIAEINALADQVIANTGDLAHTFSEAELSVCVATTDVHEFGKILIDKVLREMNVTVIDGGISTDPDALAALAKNTGADAIAISTYNGIALRFLNDLQQELKTIEYHIPVFVGGKLNQIPDDSNTSLPVDVTTDLEGLGAIPCTNVETMIRGLTSIVQ